MMHRFVSPVLLFGLLLLSACSEPTGVGANLGEGRFGEGTPQAFVEVASTLDTVSAVARTGINTPPPARPGVTNRSWRFLTGVVDDPLTGTIEAEGYIDFSGAAIPDSALREADLDSLDAQLRLEPEYRHGDTSSTLRIRLFDLTEEANMDRAPADTPATAFPAEMTEIQEYSISPTDTLVTLDLPQPWISEHQGVLQDTSEFGDDFNGFKLTSANGASVVGFDHGSASLRVTTSSDTVDYRALKSFTRIERRGTPSASPPDRALLQDGVGSTLLFEWDYSQALFTDSLSNTRLNKSDVIVPIDTSRMRATLSGRPNFVRPSINGYRILATRTDDTQPCSDLGLPQLQGDEQTCILPTLSGTAPGEVRLSNNASNFIFERVLDGDPLFSSFQVQIADRETVAAQNTAQRGLPTTLPALVRVANASEDELPRVNLVVTPY